MATLDETATRIDKNDPYNGTHRAVLAADLTEAQCNCVKGVGLNSNGALVVGAGVDGVIGVICFPLGKLNNGDYERPPRAGTVIEYFVDAEITNFDASQPTTGAGAPLPGKKYYSAANGDISTTNTGVLIGNTIEKKRLVVHVRPA